jgi:cytochrome P450
MRLDDSLRSLAELSGVRDGPRATLRYLRTLLRFNQRPLDELLAMGVDGPPVTRLWLVLETLYFVNDPSAIRRMLVENRNAYSRARNLEAPWLRDLLGAGLLTTDGPEWLALRRASQPAFLAEGLAAVAERLAQTTHRVLTTWQPWREPGAVVDVFPHLVALTVALALRAFFDHDVDEAEALAVAHALLRGQEHILRHLRYPFWPPDAAPLPQNIRYRADVRTVRATLRSAEDARTRRGDRDNARDLYALFAAAPGEHTPEAAQRRRDQFVTTFMAAPENTATALTWTLYLLARHPAVLASVQDELGAWPGGPAAFPARAGVFPQLRRVLNETLRLFPGAPYFDRRALADDTLAGVSIPRGSLVMVSPYVIHRTTRFWTAPAEFRPERFAPGGEGTDNPAYIPFGLGPRRCIGDQFALLILEIVLPRLLARLRPERLDPTPVDVDPQINLRPRGGMVMRLGPTEATPRPAG